MISIECRRNIRLSLNLAIGEFNNKFARSKFGAFWLMITPIGMIFVYWMVFGYTLNVSWPGLNGTDVGFVLPFFVGYSIFIFISDVITSSINLFMSKSNYVKKSPFPLWVLWAANFIRTILQATVYLLIILVLAVFLGYLTIKGLFLFLLLMLMPLIFIAAISLILSSVGPFFSDLSEASRVILRVFFYMGPITYPLSMVPDDLRVFLWLNPLTHIIVPARNALIFGVPPDIIQYTSFMFFSIIMFIISYWFFNRVKEVIVDVV